MHKIDLAKYKKVVFITAHPDDLEGFAGGLAKILDIQEAKTYSYILSEGDGGRWESKYRLLKKAAYEDIRVLESEIAKYDLGIDYIRTLDYDDRNIHYSKNLAMLSKENLEEISR